MIPSKQSSSCRHRSMHVPAVWWLVAKQKCCRLFSVARRASFQPSTWQTIVMQQDASNEASNFAVTSPSMAMLSSRELVMLLLLRPAAVLYIYKTINATRTRILNISNVYTKCPCDAPLHFLELLRICSAILTGCLLSSLWHLTFLDPDAVF